MATGLSMARRWCGPSSEIIHFWCNYMERRFRRQTKLALHRGEWESVPHKPHAIEWYVA